MPANVYQIQHIRMLCFFQKLLHLPKKNCGLLREVRQRSCPWYTFFESKEQTNTYGVSGKVIMIPSIGRREGSGPWQFVELNYPISLKKGFWHT